MRKASYIVFVFLFSQTITAQNPAKNRFNIKASYFAGLQTFKLNAIESHIKYRLESGMPAVGVTENLSFPVSFSHQAILSFTPFKNKKWFVSLNGFWGKNSLTSYGYSSDRNNNPYTLIAETKFRFLYIGYEFSREIDFKKAGKLFPFISFYLNSNTFYTIKREFIVNDKSTNAVIQKGTLPNDNGTPYKYGSPYIFWLFDNPKLGLNYEIKLLNHTYLSLSYSYWWGNSYLNELYSTRGYIFNTAKGRMTTKDIEFHTDLYSHNVSMGLTFKFLK